MINLSFAIDKIYNVTDLCTKLSSCFIFLSCSHCSVDMFYIIRCDVVLSDKVSDQVTQSN